MRRRGSGSPREAVGRERVGLVRHRDDDARAPAGALALEQRGQDLDHRRLRACGEVGDLHGRKRRGRVVQHTGVAEVVEVVAGIDRTRACRRRSR